MAITPADIDQLTFSPSKHGYDTEEVDTFLEQLSGDLDAMLKKIANLKSRLTQAENDLAVAKAELKAKEEAQAQQPATPAAPVPAGEYSASERQISQVLIVAQQSADKIMTEAKEAADHIRTEADQKAREVIRQALAEKQQELDEIDRLKASREEFRTEYKNLLQHFIDDADAAFPNSVLSPTSHAPQVAEKKANSFSPVPTVANTVNVDDLD